MINKLLNGIKYIWLIVTKIVFVTLLAIALGIAPAFAQQSCENLMATSSYREVVTIDLPDIPDPTHHRFNIEAELANINPLNLRITLKAKKLSVGDIHWSKTLNTYLKVKDIPKPNEVVFEAFRGIQLYFLAQKQNGRIHLTGQRMHIPSPAVIIQKNLEDSFKSDPEFIMNHYETFSNLFSSHLQVSRNPKDVQNHANLKRVFKIVYEQLFSKIRKNEKITVADITNINRLIARTTLGIEHVIFAGVSRGSVYSEVQGNTLIKVDLASFQMSEGGFYYLPASQVPKALEALAEKINAINRNSNLSEALLIYEEYINIHPFIDGNGRTGRVLLDFVLIKAGFKGLRHQELTIDQIFKTNQQVYDEALNLMINDPI